MKECRCCDDWIISPDVGDWYADTFCSKCWAEMIDEIAKDWAAHYEAESPESGECSRFEALAEVRG